MFRPKNKEQNPRSPSSDIAIRMHSFFRHDTKRSLQKLFLNHHHSSFAFLTNNRFIRFASAVKCECFKVRKRNTTNNKQIGKQGLECDCEKCNKYLLSVRLVGEIAKRRAGEWKAIWRSRSVNKNWTIILIDDLPDSLIVVLYLDNT